jgi:hypothetical protein
MLKEFLQWYGWSSPVVGIAAQGWALRCFCWNDCIVDVVVYRVCSHDSIVSSMHCLRRGDFVLWRYVPGSGERVTGTSTSAW